MKINLFSGTETRFGDKVVFKKPWYSQYISAYVDGEFLFSGKNATVLAKEVYSFLLNLDRYYFAVTDEHRYIDELHELAEFVGLVYDDYVED